MSNRDEEQRGYHGLTPGNEADMPAYRRGQLRREGDDRARRAAEEGGGGAGILIILGGLAVVGGLAILLPYVVALLIATIATPLLLRFALPAMGAPAGWPFMETGVAFLIGALAVAALVGIGMISAAAGGPIFTPMIDHISHSEQMGDFYRAYVQPGYYLVYRSHGDLVSVALVWAIVTGRYLNRMLEPGRVKGAARAIALGLLAVAAYGAGLALAGMVVPGTYSINSGASGFVEVETGS